MWTTLALVAALSAAPAQADQLTFLNVRSVTGYFGPERPGQVSKILPGDLFALVFDIDGFKADANGKILYRMAMQVTDAKGKVIHGSEPEDREAFNSLGGNRVPASALVEARFDQPPGEYTVTVTVTDRTAKAAQKLVKKFELLPKTFGIVQLVTTIDPPTHRVAVPPSGVVGEFRFVNFSIVGFERDTVKKQPNIYVEMRILDEKGKPVSEPSTFEVNKNVPDNLSRALMQFPLALNRPGKFKVELQATDRVSKKKAELSFPLTSVEQKSTANASEQK